MKTEKEKMLAGEDYDCSDPELMERWHTAKELMKEYNNCSSRDVEKLDMLQAQLLGSKGARTRITAPFSCDYGDNIHLGNNVEINHNCVFLDCNRITIGNNVLIAPNVQLYAVGHPVDPRERVITRVCNGVEEEQCTSLTAPITIGNNVWIGGGVIVLPGVTIGDNTTIGAGSVVTKSIPANVLAVGNPCRVIRNL